MDSMEFAEKMIEYGKLHAKMEELKAELTAHVMAMEKPATQTVGNVKAAYSAGRKSFDYEAGVKSHGAPGALIEEYTTEKVTVTTDWRKIFLAMELKPEDAPVKSQSAPSVTISVS